MQEVCDLHKVGLPEAAGGEGGGAHPDAAGHHGALVPGHAVLVQGDVRQVEHLAGGQEGGSTWGAG